MHIIDFSQTRNAYERYDNVVSSARTMAAEMHERLMATAINIATAGPWREWNASIPEGTKMKFDPDALADCGDPIVARLVQAADALEDLL